MKIEFYHLTNHEVCFAINDKVLIFYDETYKEDLNGSQWKYLLGKILWYFLKAFVKGRK